MTSSHLCNVLGVCFGSRNGIVPELRSKFRTLTRKERAKAMQEVFLSFQDAIETVRQATNLHHKRALILATDVGDLALSVNTSMTK